MDKLFGMECEKAIRLLCKHMPQSDELVKPTLFHSIRTGVYLYEHHYPKDIVIAGLLHDILEDTELTKTQFQNEFGGNVASLVAANSKDTSIPNSSDRIDDLMKRCIGKGEDALIVKTADVIDNFKYFSQIKDKKGIDYCIKNASSILNKMPNNFSDRIFDDLRKEYKKHI